MNKYVRGLALASGVLALSLTGWLLASATQPQSAVKAAVVRSPGHPVVHGASLPTRDRSRRGQEQACPGRGHQPAGGAALACPVSVTTASLPDAMLGTRYSVPMLAASGGAPPYTWSVSDRWLPPGLSLSPAGVISGSPVLAGAFEFTVQAADSTGATATVSLSITVGGCVTSITGSHRRPLTIGAGVTCLDQATISGPVKITAGAVVSIQASALGGPLSADGPASLAVCGSTISGPGLATRASGPVLFGRANGTPCAADKVTGQVTLTGDVGGVTLGGATVSGPVYVTGDSGRVIVSANTIGGPASVTENRGSILVAGNSVNGALSCSGNDPAPTEGGKTNTSNGPATGQCSSLGHSPMTASMEGGLVPDVRAPRPRTLLSATP
jgi:Putative Ig domain